MNFIEFVKAYSNKKLREQGTAKVSHKEILKLREAYKKLNRTSLREGEKAEPKKATFREFVVSYLKVKKAKTGSAKLTEAEYTKLKKAWTRKLQEAKSKNSRVPAPAPRTRESISNKTKKRHTREGDEGGSINPIFDEKDSEASESFPEGLEESLTFLKVIKQYKKFKEKQTGDNKISMREMKNLKREYRKLKEADAVDPMADPAADPGAQAADPAQADPALAGAAPVDPTVTAEVSKVLADVNALAAAAGVQATDLGPNAAGGVPPVDGMGDPAADPAQAPAEEAPLVEALKKFRAWKIKNKKGNKVTLAEAMVVYNKLKKIKEAKPKTRYEQIKERIANRGKALKGLQENGATDWVEEKLALVKGISADVSGDKSDSTDELGKVPDPSKLAQGYASGKSADVLSTGKTWPTKAMGKEAGGALQGEGAKMKEAVSDVTKRYVDNYLSGEKLSFKKLNEALSTGLLG